MKKCSKCRKNKPVNEFWRETKRKDGLNIWCKDCHRAIRQTPKYQLREKLYRKSERRKNALKKYNHSGKNKEVQERYRKTEKRKISQIKYDKSEKGKKARKRWMIKRMGDISFRINRNISNGIHHQLKNNKNGSKWKEIIGYSIKELMKHLEKQFDNKMNWDNYGSYWHIDHIKPKVLFNFKSEKDKEFKDCWALFNLQPLEATENMLKRDKYDANLASGKQTNQKAL